MDGQVDCLLERRAPLTDAFRREVDSVKAQLTVDCCCTDTRRHAASQAMDVCKMLLYTDVHAQAVSVCIGASSTIVFTQFSTHDDAQ